MEIPGAPESIEWAPVAAFLQSLGLDLRMLTSDGVRIGYTSIECTVYALNHQGQRYAVPSQGPQAVNDWEVATHRISIPIIHEND